MPSFADKVVLITGSARGCGAALAEAFANAGATVVGCDVDADEGERPPRGSARQEVGLTSGRLTYPARRR